MRAIQAQGHFSITIFFALFLLAFVNGCGSNAEFSLDFNALHALPPEAAFIITDYPVGEEEFYEISTGLVDLPAHVSTGRGLRYSANNHSDDIDSNLIISLGSAHGLEPATQYSIRAVFSFYSNVPRGCSGVGVSPDAVAFYLCASSDPAAKERVADDNNYWDLPLGNDGTCGEAGDIGTSASDCLNPDSNAWSLETRTSDAIQVQTGGTGDVFISIRTHSGFEATSTFYYRTATFTLSPIP